MGSTRSQRSVTGKRRPSHVTDDDDVDVDGDDDDDDVRNTVIVITPKNLSCCYPDSMGCNYALKDPCCKLNDASRGPKQGAFS